MNSVIPAPENGPSATNLRTRSTGTVHAAADGVPLCPARSTRTDQNGPYVETVDAVTCRSCVKLAPTEAVESPAAVVVALTGDQLDGIACIRCERTDTRMVPAGSAEHGQLFQCADHDTPACPTWCNADDHGGDDPGERAHWGYTADVPLSLTPTTPGAEPPSLMATLLKVEGEYPRDTHVSVSDTLSGRGLSLTLDEADQLAECLRTLTAQARASAAPVTLAAVPPGRPGCEPWCTVHEDGTGHPDDGFCKRPAAEVHELYLSTTDDDGPMVFGYQARVDELRLDEAERMGRGLLDLVATGRGAASTTSTICAGNAA